MSHLKSLLVCVSFLLLTITGCTQMETPPGYAECPICKENGDMACLHVKIEKDTPYIEEDSKRRYFCSEDCKAEYLKATKDVQEGFQPKAASCGLQSACSVR